MWYDCNKTLTIKGQNNDNNSLQIKYVRLMVFLIMITVMIFLISAYNHLRKSLHTKWTGCSKNLIADLFALTRLKHFSESKRESMLYTLTGKLIVSIEPLYFLLDNLYVRFLDKVFRQEFSISMGINCAH